MNEKNSNGVFAYFSLPHANILYKWFHSLAIGIIWIQYQRLNLFCSLSGLALIAAIGVAVPQGGRTKVSPRFLLIERFTTYL